MIFGLKILIKYGCEIPNGFFLAKFGFLIYHKSSENSKQNNGQNLSNSPYCLVKLFKLLELMFLLKANDQHQFLDYIKPHLEDITDSDLTASRALISNSSGKVAVSSISSTKLGYLADVTSNIQAQINGKTTMAAVEAKGYITGINSSDVTAALGYTPENVANLVTSISGTSTDSQYPSAKLVYDQLSGKQATLVSGTNIKTINSNSLLGSGDIIIDSLPS